MRSEKHAIRDGAIVGVVSGLILAVLLRSWFRGAPAAGVVSASSVAAFLRDLVPNLAWIPVVVLCIGLALGVALAIVALFRSLRTLLRGRPREPEWHQYTSDRFFGVVWRWRYDEGIVRLRCFCPHCDQELICAERRSDQDGATTPRPAEFTEFQCEKCGMKSDQISGDLHSALGTVEREIKQRIWTEEWKRRTGAEEKG